MNAKEENAEGVSRLAFALLFFSLMCVGFNLSVIYSVLPPILRELALPDISFAIINGASTLLWTFFSPIWGRWGDERGQRPVLLIGFLGWGVSSLMFGVVVELAIAAVLGLNMTLALLAASRAVVGLVASGTLPAANAYVAVRTSRRDRAAALASLSAAFGFGAMLGPAVGAALVEIGYAGPFYVTAALTILSAIAIGLYLPERRITPEERRNHAPRPPVRLGDPRVLPFTVISGAVAYGQASIMATFGFFVMDAMKLAPAQATFYVGFAMTARAVALMITQLGIIRLTRPTPRQMMLIGTPLSILAFVIFAVTENYPVVVGAMILLGGAVAYLMPGNSAAASLAVGRDEQGVVAGMLGSANAFVFMLGPFITLPLYHLSHVAAHALNIAVMAGVLAIVLRRKDLGRLDLELRSLGPTLGQSEVQAQDVPARTDRERREP